MTNHNPNPIVAPTFGAASLRGTEGGSATPPPIHPDSPGYCYLALFRDEHWPAFARVLGLNPWFASVVSLAYQNTGYLAPSKFTLTTTTPIPTDGQHFVQWHLTRGGYVTTKEVLTAGLPYARLGAELQSALPGEIAPTHAASLHLAASAPPRDLVLPFAFVLAADHAVLLSIPTSATWRAATATYESVELLGFQFTAHVTGGAASQLRFRVATEAAYHRPLTAWVTALYAARFAGDDNTVGAATWTLPRDHPYGRELKATVLGNPPPLFQFHCGGTGGTAEVRGHLTVRPSGSAPPTVWVPTTNPLQLT